MATYKTRGLVVKRFNIGEADRILTLYTRNFGKIRAVAKGVRKMKSRRSGHLELFMVSDMVFAKGKNLDVITDSAVVEDFGSVRKSLFKASLAYYIAEMIDGFFAEEEKDAATFDTIIEAIKALDDAERIGAGALIVRALEVKLLERLGLGPNFDFCIVCNEKVNANFQKVSISGGGAVCGLCERQKSGLIKVSPEVLKLVRFMRGADFRRVARLRIKNELLLEIEGLLGLFVKRVLERELASQKFCEEVREMK